MSNTEIKFGKIKTISKSRFTWLLKSLFWLLSNCRINKLNKHNAQKRRSLLTTTRWKYSSLCQWRFFWCDIHSTIHTVLSLPLLCFACWWQGNISLLILLFHGILTPKSRTIIIIFFFRFAGVIINFSVVDEIKHFGQQYIYWHVLMAEFLNKHHCEIIIK